MTPCEELGYKVGDKFTNKVLGIITLEHIDMTTVPGFVDKEGKLWWLPLDTVIKLKQSDEVERVDCLTQWPNDETRIDAIGQNGPTGEHYPTEEGRKYDTGKPIMGAIPPNAELAVARVLTYGAAKYSRDNWEKVPDAGARYMDAALRHINALRRGETVDAESGEHHLAHAVCCLLFLLEVEERGLE